MSKKSSTSLIDVQEIAKSAAIEALKLQRTEERQRIRKNRFHNTELLLKNYSSLIEHFQSAIDSTVDIQDDLDSMNFENLDMDDIIIQSIRRSKIRTRIMIGQIDTCLAILRAKMAAKDQEEKCVVIQMLYLDSELSDRQWGERIELIAAELHCGEASVYRWKNEMIRELGVLLFGVDGLQLEV